MECDSTTLAIVFSVTEFLTALISLFRLSFRLKIRRLWWEDVWAAVAMVGMVAFASVNLIYSQTKIFEAGTIARWVTSHAFTSIVWSVRMSLLYSIVRVISPSNSLRNITRAIGALFVIVWAVLVSLKTWWCMSSQSSLDECPACLFSNPIVMFGVTAGFAGDTVLVVLSLRLLWRVKLPRRQRRMILSIFSSSAVMSMTSLPRAIPQVPYEDPLRYIFVNLELISSLVVCNLLVVVTYIYRVYLSSSGSEGSLEDDDFTTPASRSAQSLTTVDLNTSGPTTTAATDHITSGSSPSLVRSATSRSCGSFPPHAH